MSEAAEVSGEVRDPRSWNDKRISREYECFGIAFEDDRDAEGGSVCMGVCLVRDRCLMVIARKITNIEEQKLGKSQVQNGAVAGDADVAEGMGAECVDGVTIGRKLLGFLERNKGGHPTGRWRAGTEGNPIEKFLPPQASPSAELLEALKKQGPTNTPVDPAAVGGLSLVLGGPEPETQSFSLPTEAVIKPAKKKAAKKKSTKKTAPPPKVRAKAPPKKKVAAKKKAVPVPAPKKPTVKKAATKKAATKKKVAKKGTLSRFERERARSPKVAALETGTVLEREFGGKLWKVTVLTNGYKLDGKKFETLYSTVVHIAGTQEYDRQGDNSGKRAMANWSSPKFWRL